MVGFSFVFQSGDSLESLESLGNGLLRKDPFSKRPLFPNPSDKNFESVFEIALKLQMQSCEKVPVKTFTQLNRAPNGSGTFRGVFFRTFRLTFRFAFRFGFKILRGTFVLQRCHPSVIMLGPIVILRVFSSWPFPRVHA